MSKKKTKEIWNREIHPDWYYDIPEMKVLIIGSFPPHEDKYDYEFYYPNKQNNFWKILSRICTDADPKYYGGTEAVEERKSLMKKLKAGVQNMGKIISRKEKSARDTDIKIEEFNDILSVIDQHPELETILISGYSAANSSYRAFVEYLKVNNIDFTIVENVSPGETFAFSYKGRILKCVIVNSTSTASRIKLDTLVEQFSAVIKNL